MTLSDIAIIIPSLNPDEKFSRVVDGMRSVGFSRFILVDDGSDKAHKMPFEAEVARPDVSLITHVQNMGKGHALKDAMNFVLKNLPEIDAVITIDGDGQHKPEDALKLAHELIEHDDKIVFGCRDISKMPGHNKAGNIITALIFKLFVGLKISDAQTGLRGFPRKYLKAMCDEVEGTRYEYESNVLIYMSEKKIPYSEVPIETVYIDDNQSSHFRVVKDSIRIYAPIIKKSKSLKYTLSSIASALFELIIFTILNSVFQNVAWLWLQTFLTTGLSRIISAVFNFAVNKKYVFDNDSSVKKTGIKYFILAVFQYAASYLLCWFFFSIALKSGGVGFVRTIIKLFIDLALFFISYFIQKHWVFKKEMK